MQNVSFKGELEQAQLRLSQVQKPEEDVDFDRDSNEGSFMRGKSKKDTETQEREKKFLLTELKQIKDQLYGKLTYFKSKTQGKRHPSKAKQESDAGLFEILADA